MGKHIEVVGVDHGWSGMKTVSQVFTTGVKEITTEPAFFQNIVEYNGSYYISARPALPLPSQLEPAITQRIST